MYWAGLFESSSSPLDTPKSLGTLKSSLQDQNQKRSLSSLLCTFKLTSVELMGQNDKRFLRDAN